LGGAQNLNKPKEYSIASNDDEHTSLGQALWGVNAATPYVTNHQISTPDPLSLTDARQHGGEMNL
jgi:hypothetical protein